MPFSFVLTTEALEKIEQYALEHLTSLERFGEIHFIGEVGYSDLTTERFPTIDELRKHSGDRKSPTDLSLYWSTLLKDAPLMMAAVQVEFRTDARKDLDELNLFHTPLAESLYEVGGVSRDWVDSTSTDIENILDAVRLRGMYKPLLIFRNRSVVHVISWGTGIIIQLFTIESLSRVFHHASNASSREQILAAKDIAQKFDLYIKHIFSESSIMEPIFTMGSALILMIITILSGFYLYPKLVPRSGILIGLEKERFQDYQNLFKFVVFTLLISGIGIKIVIEIIKALFK